MRELLELALLGDLERYGNAVETTLARAVTEGAWEGSDTLKQLLRDDVVAAGLGERTARTWRGDVYPERGHSVSATALVWSKAAHIIRGFNDGGTIRSKDGWWLALPSDEIPPGWVRGGRGQKRITPAQVERRLGIKLRLIPAKSKSGKPIGLLVAEKVRRRRGKRGGFAQASARALKKGDYENPVMFILVPQVTLKRRLHVEEIAADMQGRYPEILQRHIDVEIDRMESDMGRAA